MAAVILVAAALAIHFDCFGENIEIRTKDIPGPTSLWANADSETLARLFPDYLSRSRFWSADTTDGSTISYMMNDHAPWRGAERCFLVGRIVCSNGKGGSQRDPLSDETLISLETIVRKRRSNGEIRSETNARVRIAPGVDVLIEKAPSEKDARDFVDLVVELGKRLLLDGYRTLLVEEGSALSAAPTKPLLFVKIETTDDGQPLALSGWANFGRPERLFLEWEDARIVSLRRSSEVPVFGDKDMSLRYPFQIDMAYASPTGYPVCVRVRLLSSQGIVREMGFSTNVTYIRPPAPRPF